MSQVTSGKVLRETRERKGYDLTTVARRLRIRPDILRAIEAGDYSNMPPRGYARNMVNAYARLLGLNPTEIVNMYLDEAYANQVERARGTAPSSGFDMERASRTGRRRNRGMRDVSDRNGVDRQEDRETVRPVSVGADGRYTRALYDDRTRFSHDGYGLTRERAERPGKSERDFMSHHSGYSAASLGSFEDRSRRIGREVRVGQTPMEYSASRVPSFLQSRWVPIVAGVIVVAIIVVVAFAVFGNKGAKAEDDVTKLPVSGISDTTGASDSAEATGLVEVAPTSARVAITVKQGQECYLEAYENNKTTPYMLTGPAQENIEVTGVWTVATWTPEYATITVDGQAVELTPNDQYNGMYAYTVDFPAMLTKWRETHTSREAQRSAALASANQSSSAASAAAQEPAAQEPAEEEQAQDEQQDEEQQENGEGQEGEEG